jgi:peptide/nickel transport system permease protein
MFKYITRRLLQAIPTLFGVSLISFLIMANAPGGPTAALAQDPKLTAEARKLRAANLGVDDSWPVQYLRWLVGDDWMRFDRDGDGIVETSGTRKGIIRGDWGYSFVNRRPVMQLILERAPATLELGITALVLALVLGLPIGIIAAVRHGGLFDNVTRVTSVVLRAVPIFWLGLMLILLFGAWLKILPMGSRCPTSLGGCPPIYLRLNHLILPALVLAAGSVAGYSRYLRGSMLDVIGQDYIRTAQAKGLTDRMVWVGHAARNALIPVATFLGPALTGLLSGAVVTETIFSWPGLGRLAIQSINTFDYPMIMAVTMLGAVATVLGFLISDVLYALIDPRIRFS